MIRFSKCLVVYKINEKALYTCYSKCIVLLGVLFQMNGQTAHIGIEWQSMYMLLQKLISHAKSIWKRCLSIASSNGNMLEAFVTYPHMCLNKCFSVPVGSKSLDSQFLVYCCHIPLMMGLFFQIETSISPRIV